MPATHSGRRGRRSRRDAPAETPQAPAYLTRKIPVFEILNEEGLQQIEANAETILSEIGIEFRDDDDALAIWKNAGAHIDGQRVRFDRGMCRQIVQDNAPTHYTQHARNPARSVIIGGKHTVLAPAYGPPFIRDLDNGRRSLRAPVRRRPALRSLRRSRLRVC